MFKVLYRFKIKENAEQEFINAWVNLTKEFKKLHGGLGSCLHKNDKGEYVAYASWPDRSTWEKKKNILDKESLVAMNNCIEDQYPPETLEVICDYID